MKNESIFPEGLDLSQESIGPGGEVHFPELSDGLTLRDWFAGQALSSGYVLKNSIRARPEGGGKEFAARACYALADAMLAERERS